MPTVTAGGLHVGEVRVFLIKYYGIDVPPNIREPLATVTTLVPLTDRVSVLVWPLS
jgi:DNA (cytosine-5)-methyltransferase 1